MRELIADMFITLDGYALGEGAPAYFGYFGPDLERWIDEQLAKPQVLLMGRTTYEMMASIAQAGSDKPSKRMNELPKLVVSKVLKEPLAWSNSTRVDLNGVKAIKQQTGDPMRTIGSVSLVKNLLRTGLVDRLRLMVFPQILKSLVAPGESRSSLNSQTSAWNYLTPRFSIPGSLRSSTILRLLIRRINALTPSLGRADCTWHCPSKALEPRNVKTSKQV